MINCLIYMILIWLCLDTKLDSFIYLFQNTLKTDLEPSNSLRCINLLDNCQCHITEQNRKKGTKIIMKLNLNIKIRKPTIEDNINPQRAIQNHTPAINDGTIQNSLKLCQENMLSLMSMFQGFMKATFQNSKNNQKSVSQSQTYRKMQFQYQTRDRHIIFELPDTDQKQIRSQIIQRWITDVSVAAFSSSFNYYLTQQMTFEQAKIFCSETILANLLRFTEKYKLNQKHLEMINRHLSSKVFEYLQKKYPLTLGTDVNKALQKELQQTNNFQQLSNDFLYSNGLIFKYREDGNYNDMIMKVINKTLEIVDGPSLKQTKNEFDDQIPTNYQDFQQYMSSLFTKVHDEDWMNSRKGWEKSVSMREENKILRSQNKEKYKQKVKQYTHYLIGRKLSENTPQFTQQEIKGKNLTNRNPAILRILTKWCEQLWQKFEKQSYYSERAEALLLEDPEFINPFFKWMRQGIDAKMSIEKKKILEFKNKLDSHYNHQEATILLKYLEEDTINFIPKLEKAYGMFASHMVKNLHSYIVLYLNRLIHGILSVSKEFFQERIKSHNWNGWHAPPNLITLKTGDLMRCKCSSKQKQIIKIYKEIMNRSEEDPQKLKIVRIKNRLREGTNDILINVKFNNCLVCQIQLEVSQKKKSKFIECSNAFSHYIYELKRSIFGPITQLCNIWNNYDARASTFSKLVNKPHISPNFQGRLQIPECKKYHRHKYQTYDLPFECSGCKKLYFHNNYIFSNKSCQQCSIYWCSRCQIREMKDEELKHKLFKAKSFQSMNNQVRKLHNGDKIPRKGACIKVESGEPKVEIFRYGKVQQKYWLLGINQRKQIYQIFNIRSQDKIQQFFRDYLVFQFESAEEQLTQQITQQKKKIFAVGRYITDSFKQQKQILFFTQIDFDAQQLVKLMQKYAGTQRQRRKIKRIEIAGNNLSDISFFAAFDHIKKLNLDHNQIHNLKVVTSWPKLAHLQAGNNKQLREVAEEIAQLQNLEYLKLSDCNLSKLPQNFGNLKNLSNLKLQFNQLQVVPDSFWTLTSLSSLNLSNNRICELPDKFEQLYSLKNLKISYNQLKELPESITKLSNLTILNVQYNVIQKLPANLNNLSKLQKLEIDNNSIEDVPPQSLEIQALKFVYLNHNKLQHANWNFSKCKNLRELQLHQNQITEISPTIGDCSELTKLSLKRNKIIELPHELSNCTQLSKKIDLNNNCLKTIPSFVYEFKQAYDLNLDKNQIEELPDMQRLKFAQTLSLAENRIRKIDGIMSVFVFDFRHNKIEEIPYTILWCECVKIRQNYLFQKLSSNCISWIDPRLLEGITYSFKLTHNHLPAIPLQSFRQKDRLRILNCSYNKIKEIPRQINTLVNLNELDLTHNLIEVIPQELEELTKIEYPCLHLSKNPIKTVECVGFVLQKSHYYTSFAIDEFLRMGKVTLSQEEEEFYIDYDNYENDRVRDKTEQYQRQGLL